MMAHLKGKSLFKSNAGTKKLYPTFIEDGAQFRGGAL
jgi:hypothetical protein